jgi:MFS family permease
MFSSLRHRAFRRYWIGLFLSNIGSWMQTVAQGWLVLSLSDSALVLGLVTFAGSLPALVLAPFAGVAADRYDRRAVLLATQSVQMFSALLLWPRRFWGFATVARRRAGCRVRRRQRHRRRRISPLHFDSSDTRT